VRRLVGKEKKKRAKLAQLGISYDFPGYAQHVKPRASHITFD